MNLSKDEIESKTLLLANDCAVKLQMQIVYVEYVLENGVKILRVICKGENNLTIDEVTKLNELISDRLDVEDFIDEEYYLEVSSEGIERQLRNDTDIKEAIGKYIYVKMNEKVDGMKETYGDLVDFDGNTCVVEYRKKSVKKQIVIDKKMISKIRLAVRF